MKFKRILKESLFDNYNERLQTLFSIDLNNYHDELIGGVADSIVVEQILKVPIDELIRGIETEFEHTNDPYKALSIALDHLFENPPNSFRYYDEEEGLPNMERTLGI